MPEVDIEKKFSRTRLRSLCFEAGKRSNEKGKLKEKAQQILDDIVSDSSFSNLKAVTLLTLIEAINEGRPILLDEEKTETQAHIFTPLSRDIKPQEVVKEHEYNDRRWYQPQYSLPPDSASLVFLIGPFIQGKSTQKVFVTVGPGETEQCFHYGISSSAERLPKDTPLMKMPEEKIISGDKTKRTAYGYRTDGIYYRREEMDKETLRNILLAISDKVGLQIPSEEGSLKRMSEILPPHIEQKFPSPDKGN